MSKRDRVKKKRNMAIRAVLGGAMVVSAIALFAHTAWITFNGAGLTDIILRFLAMLLLLFAAGNIISPVIRQMKIDEEKGKSEL